MYIKIRYQKSIGWIFLKIGLKVIIGFRVIYITFGLPQKTLQSHEILNRPVFVLDILKSVWKLLKILKRFWILLKILNIAENCEQIVKILKIAENSERILNITENSEHGWKFWTDSEHYLSP
jgi:hypothetical protein